MIYSLPLPRETQRYCEKDPGGPAAVLLRFEPPKQQQKGKKASLAHSTTTLYCQHLPPCRYFYPSHLPPVPNLYVNSLFLKQCYMHIYPLVAETQRPTINSLSPRMESSRFVIAVIAV